ncbi:hypothetical protein IBT47_12905 [Erwinia sp. S43]|uniref:hypothetical protein n=1 Tax=Erwinia sp. S43 TaxID=2769339 RepID=UPI00190C42D9|nr:hypothetical protein [Erwinia sp. S43]MBK0033182.1 hypothetical protein [Erwinia sp. S43]
MKKLISQALNRIGTANNSLLFSASTPGITANKDPAVFIAAPLRVMMPARQAKYAGCISKAGFVVSAACR